MNITSVLFKAARISATIKAVSTGHIARRAKNIALGRALGRLKIWK